MRGVVGADPCRGDTRGEVGYCLGEGESGIGGWELLRLSAGRFNS